MIYYFSPYSLDKNLGKAYNDYCELVPNDDDYVCFTDADTMFLTPDYGTQIQRIVEKYQDQKVGIFTCYSNRVGNLEQCYNNNMSEDPNIINHRKIALELQSAYSDRVTPLSNIISGQLMLFQKKVWRECRFDEEGILAIDNKFSHRVMRNGYQIFRMDGVYIFHYYRLMEGRLSRQHLKK